MKTCFTYLTLVCICAGLVLTRCSPAFKEKGNQNSDVSDNIMVDAWVTNADQSALLLKQRQPVYFTEDTTANRLLIEVNPEQKFQQIEGFGAAVTGSSAYLFNKKMDATSRKILLEELFTEKGINLSYIRMTIGASDFSLSNYTYNDMPAGQKDFDLKHFSIDKDKEDVIPILKEIFTINPNMKLMGSPWSPPAWMKSNKSLIGGGKLNKEAYATYANYFVHYIQAFNAEKIPVDAITIQNEPQHKANYPSLLMTAPEQATFIKNHLGPALAKNNLSTKIILFDHNWDSPQYPIIIMNDPEAKKYVAGSAFHCYAGDVSAMLQVHLAHPDKDLYFTECSGGDWAPNFGDNLKWNMTNLIIGATKNWSKSVLLWNLALDENNGPSNGGCTDCRGVITISAQDNSIGRNVEYYVLGHASKFVKPGAYRIYSTQLNSSTLENVAFENPDGSIALIVLNTANTAQTFQVHNQDKTFPFTLSAGSVVTLTWKASNND